MSATAPSPSSDDHSADTDDGVSRGLVGQFLVAPAMPFCRHRDADLGEDLVRLQAPSSGNRERTPAPEFAAHPAVPWRRSSHREPGSPLDSQRPHRRGRARRRSFPGCELAGRQRAPPCPRAAEPRIESGRRSRFDDGSSGRRSRSRRRARRTPRSSGMRPMSTSVSGSARRNFMIGSRLWPPAISLAPSPCSCKQGNRFVDTSGALVGKL